MTLSTSIVMTYFERPQQLYNTLRSFELLDYRDFEVIIVDDGSATYPLEASMAANWRFPVRVLRLPKRRGYSNSCVPYDLGLSEAKGDIIVIQNAECLHVDDILCHARQHLTESTYLTYACYSLGKEKSARLSGEANWDLCLARGLISSDRSAIRDGDDAWYNHSVYRPCRYHFTSAISKRNVESLNGFDLRYASGIGYEDNEFLTRVLRKGLNAVVIDDHVVIHQWHYSIERGSNWDRLLRRNRLLFHFVTKRESGFAPKRSSPRYMLFRLVEPGLNVALLIWERLSRRWPVLSRGIGG